MGRRTIALLVAGVSAAVLTAACGGSPNNPGPVVPPQQFTPEPVAPAPPNSATVIESLTAKGRRSKEPATFADLGEMLDLVATVKDDETPVEELEFQWSAAVGTFEGSGATVTWRAPDGAETPLAVEITVKVVEKYGYPGQQKIYQQDVSASIAVSLHDSTAEVNGMSRQFLSDFSDSSIRDISYIMRNFLPGCYGTAGETEQVIENRRSYRIIESRLDEPATQINFGGVCPFRGGRGDACTAVPVFWRSQKLNDNSEERVAGIDWIASFYIPDKQRWYLCDSEFDGHRAAHSTFIK
jgi:hypothetical protein